MTRIKKRLLFTTIILIILVLGFTQLPIIKSWLSNQQPRKTIIPSVIHSLPSQPSNNSHGPISSNGINQGSPTNINNSSSSTISTTKNQWTISQSGVITLKEPIDNELISSGTTLAGSAATNSIGYTLIDNQVGVISQGTIPVVNGDFSAKINFKSYSTSGRLDVYSTTPNGKEQNLIEITVNF